MATLSQMKWELSFVGDVIAHKIVRRFLRTFPDLNLVQWKLTVRYRNHGSEPLSNALRI